MVLQVLHDHLDLIVKGQASEVATRLSPGHLKTSIHQTLPQTRGQLTAVTGQVVDGAVVDDGHGLIVGRRLLFTFACQCRKKTAQSVHS
jgi:hypothetical protein